MSSRSLLRVRALPLFASYLVLAIIVSELAVIFAENVQRRDGSSVFATTLSLTFTLFYFGYPFLVSVRLARSTVPTAEFDLWVLTICFVVAVATHFAANLMPIEFATRLLPGNDSSHTWLMGFYWATFLVCAFFCPIYIMYTASRAIFRFMTAIEGKRPEGFHHWIVTLFFFIALIPFGFFLIHPKVRRTLAQQT